MLAFPSRKRYCICIRTDCPKNGTKKKRTDTTYDSQFFVFVVQLNIDKFGEKSERAEGKSHTKQCKETAICFLDQHIWEMLNHSSHETYGRSSGRDCWFPPSLLCYVTIAWVNHSLSCPMLPLLTLPHHSPKSRKANFLGWNHQNGRKINLFCLQADWLKYFVIAMESWPTQKAN